MPDGMSTHVGPETSAELSEEQMLRLNEIVGKEITIHKKRIPSAAHFNDVTVSLKQLLNVIHDILKVSQLLCSGVFLIGGAATNVVAPHYPYTDFDVVFEMTTEEDHPSDSILTKARTVVSQSLHKIYTNQHETCPASEIACFEDVFVMKKCLIRNAENIWSLFSLHNTNGKCIDIKFVVRMKRSYEFSMDSFQIDLKWIVEDQSREMTRVKIRSQFGNIENAVYHAQNQLLETKNPKEIRLGGLLKYCWKKSQGFGDFRVGADLRKFVREMICRFFVDYLDIIRCYTSNDPIRSFLLTHFKNEANAVNEAEKRRILREKTGFLLELAETIEKSDVNKYQSYRRELLMDIKWQIFEFHERIKNAGLELNDENFPALS